MAIEQDLLDQLLAGRDPKEVFAKDGLLDDLKKALSERILNAELDEHLEEERSEGGSNRRNGSSKKSVLTGTSRMSLSIPRDRAGTFDPKLIAKYQRRFPDFDQKIISMYARGMRVREIRGHLEELYGIDVSPGRFAGPDLGRHRRRSGGGDGVAKPAGSHYRRVPGNGRPDLYRAPDPPLAVVRVLEGPRDGRAGAQSNLAGQGCRRRPRGS